MDENFRYKTINHSLHFIIKQVENGKLTIHPNFADEKSWNLKNKSRFVESLILSIPTQPIWCEETPFGDYIVIDGSERLQALIDFYNNAYRLQELKVRREYNDMYFRQLPFHETVSLIDRYNFSFIVINYDNQANLKAGFYRELFRDKNNFNLQSARNFAYPTAFDMLRWLRQNSTRYLDFVDNSSRWRKIGLNDARVDELFLFLVTFLIIQQDPYNAENIAQEMSVEDLLDAAMETINTNSTYATEVINSLLTTLARLKTTEGDILNIAIGRSYRERSSHDDVIAIRHLFEMFVEMRIKRTVDGSKYLKHTFSPFHAASPAIKLVNFALGH